MVLEKIKRACHTYGKSLAVEAQSGHISYNDLWTYSDLLANWIEKKLGNNKKPVVVYGHKNPLMIVCFLACVKSGRAYCPVDTCMPSDRVESIIGAVDNQLILATEDLEVEGRYVADRKIINMIIESETERISEECYVSGNDTFYIIFTSGSTGQPKGVEISENNLDAFLEWSVDFSPLHKTGRPGTILNQAPFSFDLSVMDLYTSLATGAKLYCIDRVVQNDSQKLMELLSRGKINLWVSTPSFAELCLADEKFNSSTMTELKTFWFCGEALTKETAGRLMERFPETEIINAYGPTESTVAVTAVKITKDMLASTETLPIGLPKKGTKIMISKRTEEILISGDTLAKGYFNDPTRTEEAFNIKEIKDENIRCYHTGDAGYVKDGMLYYRGRIDNQIKLHGYRIELGDIESNLLKMDGIIMAAVLPKMAEEKIRYLAAFVVCTGMGRTYADRKCIREFLKRNLPDYMIPKKVVFLDSMPMTSNGKADRKKLEESLI